MPLRFKINVIQELKAMGYTITELNDKGIVNRATFQHIKLNKSVSWKTIEGLCRALNCQPDYFLEYVPDKDDEIYKKAVKARVILKINENDNSTEDYEKILKVIERK